MRLKRILALSALAVSASLATVDRAHATYDISVSIVPSGTTTDLTFVPNSLTNAPYPTSGTTYQFMNVQVTNSATTTVSESPSYVATFTVTDNALPAGSNSKTFTISGNLNLTLNNGTGQLQNTYTSGSPAPPTLTLGAYTYTFIPPPLGYASPSLVNGSSGSGAFSLTVTATTGSVTTPEPTGFVIMGMGLVSGAGLVLRRRLAVSS